MSSHGTVGHVTIGPKGVNCMLGIRDTNLFKLSATEDKTVQERHIFYLLRATRVSFYKSTDDGEAE